MNDVDLSQFERTNNKCYRKRHCHQPADVELDPKRDWLASIRWTDYIYYVLRARTRHKLVSFWDKITCKMPQRQRNGESMHAYLAGSVDINQKTSNLWLEIFYTSFFLYYVIFQYFLSIIITIYCIISEHNLRSVVFMTLITNHNIIKKNSK